MEGDSVSLHTGVTEIQSGDVILWRFGDQDVIIARLNGPDVSQTWINVNVNKQTGDLTINNIQSRHSGDYKVQINTTNVISCRKYHINIIGVSDRDPVKSVTEGESITLKTQIQSDEEIQWRFGAENTLIAEISETANRIPQYPDVPDGRFKDRLKLNEDTGSLTIMNIRITDSGVYEADISRSRFTIHKTFTVIFQEVKSVSVMEGDSVPLHTGVTKIQRDDVILWKFGDQDVIIARLNGPDGKNWDNVNVNKQTGDLNINNIKRNQSGDYKVEIDTINVISCRKYHINIIGVLNPDRDPVKFVTEGESITLKTQIQSNEVIQWRFVAENTLIAEISLTANRNPQYHDVPDGRFKGRLKLNEDTGSLTIMNIRDTHSGVYKADIRSSRYTILRTFTVTVSGVQFVSVKRGDSVSLHTGVTEIQRDDVILWKFGDQDVIIAHLNGPDVSNKWSNMNVNKRTGDLNINNIKRDQSGDYKVQINTTNVISCRKYHINISVPSWTSTEIILIVVVIVFLHVIVMLVIGIKKGRFRSSSRKKGVKENPSRQQMLDGEQL